MTRNVHLQAVLVGGPHGGERIDLAHRVATVRAFSPSGRVVEYADARRFDRNGRLVYRFDGYDPGPRNLYNCRCRPPL